LAQPSRGLGVYDLEISITSETTLEEKYYLSELNICGSSRLGMKKENQFIADRSFEGSFSSAGYLDLSDETDVTNYFSPTYEPDGTDGLYTDNRGNRFFEGKNHLGNVLAVASDRKIPEFDGSNNFTHYTADVVSYSDYYPFGMQMPGRSANTSEYRYGAGGMEKDDEIKGEGNSYTTFFRQYDPRIGRWLSVDPLAHEFPWSSPYVAFNNNPIVFIDPDGRAAVNADGGGDPQDGDTRVTDGKHEIFFGGDWAYDPSGGGGVEATATQSLWQKLKGAARKTAQGISESWDKIGSTMRDFGNKLDKLVRGSGDHSGFIKKGSELQSSQAEKSDQAAIKANSEGSIDVDWFTASKGGPSKLPTWSTRTEQVQNILEGVQKAQEAYEEYKGVMAPSNNNNQNSQAIGKVEDREVKQSLRNLTVYQDSITVVTPDAKYRIQKDDYQYEGTNYWDEKAVKVK